MTEIQKPQPDSKDQSPGMPRWLIGAMLGVAIYLIVGFVLVQFYNPLFEDFLFFSLSHCDDVTKGPPFMYPVSLVFRELLILSFINPVLLFFKGTLKIPTDLPLYYMTGISLFALGGAVLSSDKFTKIWRLIIGVVLLLAWISLAFILTFVRGLLLALACFG